MRKGMKTIATVLVLTLLGGTMAACGDQKSADTQSAEKEQTSKNGAASEGSQSTPEGNETVHKLTILGPEPGNQFIKYEDREEYEIWGALQDLLAENGIEIEFEAVPEDQYSVVVQTRMASSNLPDIVNVSAIDDASLVAMGKQGTILNISDLVEQYSNGNFEHMYMEKYDTGYPLIKTSEGEIYWFTNLHKGVTFEGKEVRPGLGLQIRKDWLDKLNLEMPETLADFTAAIRAFRENDVNGNGQQDEISLIAFETFENGLAQVFGLGNGLVALDTVNGRIVSPWYQDNIREYFTYASQLVQEGLIDSATIGSSDLQNQRLAENLVGVRYAYDSASYLNSSVTNGTEGVDYEPVFTLTDAVEGTTPWKEVETSQLVWDRFCITKSCKDLEGAMKLLDMIYSEEYSTLISWGIEGTDYEMKDGVKNLLIESMSDEEKAAARRSIGSVLWRGLLPRVQTSADFNTREEWAAKQSESRKTDIQIDAVARAVDYEQWYPMMLENFLAMATDDENEVINRVQTGLETYSEELSMKLVLGTASLDDFDTYLEELKELGLDELIAVQQARYDRFVQNQQ